MMPVYEWMTANNVCGSELSFSSARFIPSTTDRAGFGLESNNIRFLIERGIKWIPEEQIIPYHPDIIVMADADFMNGIDRIGARIVNVNHGLISKGIFYSDSPLTGRENSADLICVPGPYHRDALKRRVYKPVIVSGLVKFDRIFSGEITRDTVLNKLGIDPQKKVILFAPTFNKELSAVPIVTDSVCDWVSDDVHLVIKLHNASPPEWFELYRLIGDSDPRITLVDDLDITPCLVAGDVMVSDVSSAFMEFIALDKPVVLLNNPLRTRFIGFDPRDIEYTWRRVGLEVDKTEDVPRAIEISLNNPAERSNIRRLYGTRLIGPSDGRASERIGKAIWTLAYADSGKRFNEDRVLTDQQVKI